MRRVHTTLFASTAVVALIGAAAARADETVVYVYDSLGRLVTTQTTGTVNAGETKSICYDRAGNRLRYKDSPSGVVAACLPLAPVPSPSPLPTPTPSPTPTPTPTPTPPPDDPGDGGGCHWVGATLVCE
ncbi:hypothetical protein [Sphingomonas sp.]|uniref:hypothetical protein n=1 Tax=Sphingomonas sp. TaxID=28214 RepID=UPI001B105B41|nr:hypothetical protein [Sphingomonas sp.]MBO9711433.1 hypothetical protein [Sphingomonas sp.]